MFHVKRGGNTLKICQLTRHMHESVLVPAPEMAESSVRDRIEMAM